MRRMRMVGVAAAFVASAAMSAFAQGTVPAGGTIPIVLNETVSSKDAEVGQRVSGSVAENVVIDGRTVIPRGANASLTVASAQPSGRLKGVAKLYLRLDSIDVRGRTYVVSAHWAGRIGTSHKKRNVEAIGGGTAAGAVIGAIAGGGKGAAIGAAAGAGAGTTGAALTGKKDITYKAETRLSFKLKMSLKIR